MSDQEHLRTQAYALISRLDVEAEMMEEYGHQPNYHCHRGETPGQKLSHILTRGEKRYYRRSQRPASDHSLVTRIVQEALAKSAAV